MKIVWLKIVISAKIIIIIYIIINYELDRTRRKASEICLRPPLDIYSHTVSR